MNSLQIQDGQNVYDVAVSKFGDATKTLSIVLDNDQNLDYDLTGIKKINYTQSAYLVPSVTALSQKEVVKQNSYVTVYGQNIYDVSLQIYGNAANPFLLTENSLDDDIENNISVVIKEFKSPFTAQKQAIDLSGRIIGTKTYISIGYRYIGTELGQILTTESGFRMILE